MPTDMGPMWIAPLVTLHCFPAIFHSPTIVRGFAEADAVARRATAIVHKTVRCISHQAPVERAAMPTPVAIVDSRTNDVTQKRIVPPAMIIPKMLIRKPA